MVVLGPRHVLLRNHHWLPHARVALFALLGLSFLTSLPQMPQLALFEIFSCVFNWFHPVFTHFAWIIDWSLISRTWTRLVAAWLHPCAKGYGVNQSFKFVKFALLQIIKQNLFLLAIAHRPELGQFVHLENWKRFLIVLLLFPHCFQLLQILHSLNLLLLVLIKNVQIFLCTLPAVPGNYFDRFLWVSALEVSLALVLAFQLVFKFLVKL